MGERVQWLWLNSIQLTFADITFYPASNELKTDTTTEVINDNCKLLLIRLALVSGYSVSRDELIELIWQKRYETGDKGLNTAVWQLRKHFSALNAEDIVERVPKLGYKFTSHVDIHWVYPANSSCSLNITSQDGEARLLVDSFPVTTTAEAQVLISHLFNPPSATTSIPHLAELLSCSTYDALLHILHLQYQISALNPNAQYFLSTNTKQVYFNDAVMHCATTAPKEPRKTIESSDGVKHNTHATKKVSSLLITSVGINLLFVLLFFVLVNNHTNTTITAEDTHDIAFKLLSEIQYAYERNAHISLPEVVDISDKLVEDDMELHPEHEIRNLKLRSQIARINLEQNRFEVADVALSKILAKLDIIPKTTETTQSLYVTTMVNMAWLHAATDELDEAGEYIRKAFDPEFDKIPEYQETWWHRTAVFNKVSLQSGDFEQVLVACEKMDGLLKNFDAPKDILQQKLNILSTCAVGLRQVGRIDEAAETLTTSLILSKQVYGKKHRLTYNRTGNLGVVHAFKGNYSISEEYYQETIAIAQELEDVEIYELPLFYSNLSYSQFELGKTQEALDSIQIAIDTYSNMSAPQDSMLGYFYLTKAHHLFNLGEFEQSKDVLKISRDKLRTNDQKTHPVNIKALMLIANLARVNGDATQCAMHVKLAQQRAKESFSDPTHWQREITNAALPACQLAESSLNVKAKKDIIASLHRKWNELKNNFGEQAFPGRIFLRSFPDVFNKSINVNRATFNQSTERRHE